MVKSAGNPAPDTEPTPVAFRVDKYGPHKGEVTAVFPAHPGRSPAMVECYAHVGQHHGCSWSWIFQDTRPAKPAEYAALKRELESIGYTLRVVSRVRR